MNMTIIEDYVLDEIDELKKEFSEPLNDLCNEIENQGINSGSASLDYNDNYTVTEVSLTENINRIIEAVKDENYTLAKRELREIGTLINIPVNGRNMDFLTKLEYHLNNTFNIFEDARKSTSHKKTSETRTKIRENYNNKAIAIEQTMNTIGNIYLEQLVEEKDESGRHNFSVSSYSQHIQPLTAVAKEYSIIAKRNTISKKSAPEIKTAARNAIKKLESYQSIIDSKRAIKLKTSDLYNQLKNQLESLETYANKF